MGGMRREIERLREKCSSLDVTVKWTQNKLKVEVDAHKVSQRRSATSLADRPTDRPTDRLITQADGSLAKDPVTLPPGSAKRENYRPILTIFKIGQPSDFLPPRKILTNQREVE